MKIDSTAAKIGRSMKKRDIICGSLLLGGRRGLLLRSLVRTRIWTLSARFAALAGRAFAVSGRGAVRDLHRSARGPHELQLHHAVNDYALAGLEAAADDPGIARPVADFHRPRLR